MSFADAVSEAADQRAQAERNKKYDGALRQWGDAWPTRDDWRDISFSRCAACGAEIGGSAPDSVHPCECGSWHRVCLACVIHHKLITTPREDYVEAAKWGRLDLCPDAVRVAHEVMGADPVPMLTQEPECPECGPTDWVCAVVKDVCDDCGGDRPE